MLGYIVIGGVALFTTWYILYRVGNPTFWKLASKCPNDAYDWFMAEDCWVVVDSEDLNSCAPELGGDHTGPFMLWIPKLGGRHVTIYGRNDEIEGSQRRFMEQFGGRRTSTDSAREVLKQALADVALCQQFQGTQYRKLVERHVRKLGGQLELSMLASVKAGSELERRVAEAMVDEYNSMGYEQSFWRRDCREVFEEICTRFAERMAEGGGQADDPGKFNMFQLITMNFAYQAREQKALRKFAGIRKGVLLRGAGKYGDLYLSNDLM